MSPRRVVAYWHDAEGTLVAGCDDGTVWYEEPAAHRTWEPRIVYPIPQPPAGASEHRPAFGTITDFLHNYVFGTNRVRDEQLVLIGREIDRLRLEGPNSAT